MLCPGGNVICGACETIVDLACPCEDVGAAGTPTNVISAQKDRQQQDEFY